MNDESKPKLPAMFCRPALQKIVIVSMCVLLIISGLLFYLEGTYSSNIMKPKWYQDLRRSVPGVAESDQRKRMLVIINTLESAGIVSTTSANSDPNQHTFHDVGKDLWGTPFRCETTNNLLSIRSAGPDKKYNTPDDRVYRK
jgi:hypothetical protein